MPQHIYKKINIGVFFTTIAIASSFLFVPQTTLAATLSIAPSASKVSVGNIVSVNVLVATDGKSINNADATIQFPTDLLEVMSVTKGSSIFSLWVEDPKFSNYNGTITFDGGLPSPGYSGQNGQVVSVVFKAKKTGVASIVFSDAAVRQNDGLGTDILSTKQSATVAISSSAQLDVPVITTTSNSLPVKPLITSSTYPAQDQWYSGTTATFSWVVPDDVTSIQTLLSKNATAVPTVTYDGSVSQRTVNNLADGVLYFHLRYMNNVGWGPTAHYKIQTDSTPPEKFTLHVTTQGTQNILALNAVDAMSGIDSYSVKIDNAPAVRVGQAELVNNQYILPTQSQGEHTLMVLAYDRAGNYTEADGVFMSPAIIPPALMNLPNQVNRGDIVTIHGVTQYPQSSVIVFVRPDGKTAKEYPTTTGADGSFIVVTDALKTSGSNGVSAQLVFSDSIKSAVSDEKILVVVDPFIVQTSKTLLYMLSFTIPAILLLAGLIFGLYIGWHKFFSLKRRLQKETQGTVEDVHRALVVFKDELTNQLRKLEAIKEDRDLNKKEEKIFKELQNNVDSIDEFIEKKINRIK